MSLQMPVHPDFENLTTPEAMTGLDVWVDDLLARRAPRARRHQRQQVRDYLGQVVALYLQDPALGALLLMPQGGAQVVDLFRVRWTEGPGPGGLDDLVHRFVMTDTLREPATVDVLTGAAGDLVRLRQRFTRTTGTGAEVVQDSTLWFWWFPDVDRTYFVQADLFDPAIVGRWWAELDDVVRHARRAEPGAPASAEGVAVGDFVS